MTKMICEKTGQEYSVSEKELQILHDISPVLEGKRYMIPISKYHPDVHQQQHLAWRNERNLYKTICALTGKPTITNINPALGYTIYNFKDRRSDKREPFDFGFVFDASKTFTEQFGDLLYRIPQISLNLAPTMDNCDYCNYGMDSKNCYMCASAIWSESCYYSFFPVKCYYDIDGYTNSDCKYCYECFLAGNCYKCQYVIYSADCRSCMYMLDCWDCEFCFSCINLSHKRYCIFNKQYDKATYLEMMKTITQEDVDVLLQKFIQFSLNFPKRATRGDRNEKSSGDFLHNTKGCVNCFVMQNARDCFNSWMCGFDSSDYVNCTGVGLSSQMYNNIGMGTSHSSAMNVAGSNMYQCFYCYYCRDCEYCFGCARMLNKKYCIFNKQYTKENYEKEVARIITRMMETGEWGEFPDMTISRFPYNDSDAYEWFPETKEEICARGGKFIERELKIQQKTSYIVEPIEVYKHNPEKRKELLNATLLCSVTGDPFKLTEQELDFYIKFDIPIPTKHHLQRYKERCALRRMPRKLYDRTCAKTGVDILTSYAPDRPEIVWAEDVWDKEFS